MKTRLAAIAAMTLLLAGCASSEQPKTITHDGGEIRIGQGIGLYPDEGAAIITTSAGVRIANLPTIAASEAGAPAGTLHIDARGFLYRVTP